MESGKYFNKLIRAIKFLESLDMVPDNVNLTQTEFRLIREIVMEREVGNRIISSELARRLNITRSAVSQLVVKLEKRGIITRTASPTDRKIFYVELSDSSLAVFKQQCDEVNELIERVVGEFGTDKADQLIKLSEEFAAVFDKLRKESVKEKETFRK